MKPQIINILLLLSMIFAGCGNQKMVQKNSSNSNLENTDATQIKKPSPKKEENFNVTLEYWKSQLAKAMEKRKGPTGNFPKGIQVPELLRGDGVIKQRAKLTEMKSSGYQIPMDFADLAEKRIKGTLVELPMANEYWVLEIGEGATREQFTSFNFTDHNKSPVIKPKSPDHTILSNLASDFSGEKYDLNNPAHRRQMKLRLLRMINPLAKQTLETIARAYHMKFKRPLKISALTRSMQNQIERNKFDPNSFRVRGKDALPPHTSGCAFDLARKHMTAEEQNFLMKKFEEMEKNGTLDALIESGDNALFHVFVYEDGKPPEGS